MVSPDFPSTLMDKTKIKKTYYPNGQIEREENLKNGIPHGQSKGYYPNGQVKWEGSFKNDAPHG